jgi:hypothetical protein
LMQEIHSLVCLWILCYSILRFCGRIKLFRHSVELFWPRSIKFSDSRGARIFFLLTIFAVLKCKHRSLLKLLLQSFVSRSLKEKPTMQLLLVKYDEEGILIWDGLKL